MKKNPSGQGAGKGFTLFISNEDIDDIIRIVESLEKPGLLIDGASKTVKHGIKKQEGGFLPALMAPMAASLIALMASSLMQPIASSLINSTTGKGQEGGFLCIVSTTFNDESVGKRSYKSRKRIYE